MICPRCNRRYEGDLLFCPHDGEQLVAKIDIKRIRSKPTEHFGTIVGGRYQVRGLIGAGAMAHVFLALDQRSLSPVAVKVLDKKHLADKRTVARFLLEAKAAAQVVHRSIVDMLDVGMGDDGAPYLVMEFLLGESLGEWLRRDKTMPIERGLPLVRQIAEGLTAVHRAGIVHRDVKPDNIFLVGEKKDPHAAKIVDFGFAKVDEHGALTQTGVTVGTVEYMSPEQAVGDPVDARSDVYALGVLMARTFSGRLPFEADNVSGMLARHLAEEPQHPAFPKGPLASGLEAIVRKALRKDPAHRYGSMAALLGDLARLERGEPLAACLAPQGADVYPHRSEFSAKAGAFLYGRLGREPPSR